MEPQEEKPDVEAERSIPGATHGLVSLSDAADDALHIVSKHFWGDADRVRLSTGLEDLDRQLGGLHPGELIILAARPSMGKTALAVGIALRIARDYAWESGPDGSRRMVRGGVAAYFSPQTSAENIAVCFLAQMSEAPADQIRSGEINYSEHVRVRDSAQAIGNAPLFIDATSGLSIAQLSERARRLARIDGLALIVVDHLQLFTAHIEPAGGQGQGIRQVTRRLKALAQELATSVIALVPLPQEIGGARPGISDLRAIGPVEEDADVILFIHRNIDTRGSSAPRQCPVEQAASQQPTELTPNFAEVIIAKQGHGPTGAVRLHFNESVGKFSPMSSC